MSKTAEPFVCGGLSGTLASCCIHPIDLAKVRLQLFSKVNPGKPLPSFPTIITDMIKKDGFGSIYSGISAAVMRQCVYGTARIGLHRTFSDELQRRNQGLPLSFGMKVFSGMASGAIAVCVGTPFDVSLVRMQADSMKATKDRRGYKNVFDALARIAKEEGFSKLYSGLGPNILRGMSMNVGQLACFDQTKEFIHMRVMGQDKKAPISKTTQLGAACVAGFTASAMSLPFDLLKSRMQDAGRGGLVKLAFDIYTKEGIFAFWTGFGAYFGRTAPHAMIILLSTEPICNAYRFITGIK